MYDQEKLIRLDEDMLERYENRKLLAHGTPAKKIPISTSQESGVPKISGKRKTHHRMTEVGKQEKNPKTSFQQTVSIGYRINMTLFCPQMRDISLLLQKSKNQEKLT